MSAELERVRVLLGLSRWAEAEREVRGVLAREPGSAPALALLVTCLLHQDKKEEALREARAAVALDPEDPWVMFALARALAVCGRPEEALQATLETLRLEPADPDCWGLLGALHLEAERWREGLEAAEKGLALDPEHAWCTELRARALVQLGRASEAGAALEARLRSDPEDAGAHTAQGYVHLDRGRFPEALKSFQEALRLEPTSAPARRGMVEALKARYRVYGWFLRYAQWMGRLTQGQRWGFIIGAYLAYRFLDDLADQNPGLRPWVRPVLWAYLAFVLFSWVTAPLGDLLLSFTRFGRLSLDPDQLRGARWIGACLVGAALFGLLGLAWAPFPGLPAAAGAAVLILPVAALWSRPPGPRLVLGAVTAGLACIGLSAIAASLAAAFAAEPSRKALEGVAAFEALAYFVGVGLVTFLANFIGLVRPPPPLGKAEELAEAGRWRLLAAAALVLGTSGLLLVLQLLGGEVRSGTAIRLAVATALFFALYRGHAWARWVAVVLFGLSAVLGVFTVASDLDLVALWVVLPLSLLHGALAAWLVVSPTLRAFLARQGRVRPS